MTNQKSNQMSVTLAPDSKDRKKPSADPEHGEGPAEAEEQAKAGGGSRLTCMMGRSRDLWLLLSIDGDGRCSVRQFRTLWYTSTASTLCSGGRP